MRVSYTGEVKTLQEKMPQKVGVEPEGTVEGKAVNNILLDTGCSRTLVRGDLVTEDKSLE